jgi:putative oxidoreductase
MKIADIRRRLVRSRLTSPAPFPAGGLLALRLVVGVTFLVHGIDKLGDLSGTERFFASLDIPAPALMAPFVAVTETLGGALLIVGLATPLVGAALTINMLVALGTAHIGKDFSFFVESGGIELELLLAGASAGIVLAGAGRFSVDAALRQFRHESRVRPAATARVARGTTAMSTEGASR